MKKEFTTYLLLIFALLIFWYMGSFVDSALWSHKTYGTPMWVVHHMDIIWLTISQTVIPLFIILLLKPKFNSLLAFGSAICFGGVIWDVNYSWLTRGLLISKDSMLRWYVLSDFDFVVGINEEYALLFHGSRIVLGLIVLFWLWFRINREFNYQQVDNLTIK